ncbi:MAG: ABC transporter substrate-binding protein [Proteobacteria bacterium]|nr:ABC transporter substrate-binding protein [Pseudomonadota bacterium]
MISRLWLLYAVCLVALCSTPPAVAGVNKSHAITLYDEAPKYGPDFKHFDYVNPNAPVGGTFRIAPTQEASFDSFNPFIARGNAVSTGSVETLMVGSEDEPFTSYGLIAETIEWPDDRSWVIFNLNPAAHWHDGSPITADDVIWTFNTLIEKGSPQYRFYYSSVDKVEKLGERRVRFNFNESNNRELPLIVGQLPVLPKDYWSKRDFAKTTLEPPLGSGPYRVALFEAGRYIVQSRVDDYWGKDHPTQVGFNNFEKIRTDFYRDVTAIRLALKSGRLDFRLENQAKAWALDYDVDVVKDGLLLKERIAHQAPQGMQGTILNTRRAIFNDVRVREAIGYAFDFEWTNRNLFFSQYTRSNSYFSNSPLAATGLPQGKELEILQAYRGQIPERVFTEPWAVPSTDGSGWARGNLRKAFALLEQAGWTVREQKLLNAQGDQFQFEILLVSQGFERIMLPWVRNLRRLGMEVNVRLVDTAQYINRMRSFEFDALIASIGQSDNPGNEQRNYWTTAAAESEGSRNFPGIRSEVIDTLVEELIQSPDRETLTAYVKAIDRLLLFGFYVVPNWHLAADRILFWDKFGRPDIPLKNGVNYRRWWFDESKVARLALAMEEVPTEEGSTDSERLWWVLILVLLTGGWMLRRYFASANKAGNKGGAE